MLAVSAMAAVSCNIINKFDVDVPKVIDDTQSVSSSKLFDINSGKNFSTDESGNLMLGYNADEKISKKVELNSSADTKIGDLVFSVPDAPTVVEKAASTDGQIILIIDNPSPEKMTVSGTIEAAPVTKASSKIKFNAIVPGNAKSYKIIIKDPIATPAKPADVVASVDEGSVKDALKGTCYASPIRVDLSGKLIVTKAAETKAEKNKVLYKEMEAEGRINFYWIMTSAATVETVYVLSQNVEKFCAGYTDEQVANITFRVFCIIDAIDQLSVYDPQIVGIAEALNPLKNLNAITLADFKKELAASKEQIEASRSAFLK